MKKWIILLLLALTAGVAAEPLSGGNWDPFNRDQLNRLLMNYGKSSPTYRPSRPPYAVIDWDNTSVFLDIEEAVITYQLAHLRFKASPAQLDQAIRQHVPTSPFSSAFNNLAGESVDLDSVAADISSSYAWLYEHYQGLGGNQSLEHVKRSPHYLNFITKMRYLYEAIDATFHAPVSYPWITYFFTAMTQNEVAQLTRDTLAWELAAPIEKVSWTSPAELAGQAGIVSVSWKSGLRLLPEMQQLYAALRQQGFDVWVCSATFVDIIREISSNPAFGYANPADHVLAMELERDEQGHILSQLRSGYEQPYGPGKTLAIRRRLLSLYGYGPILVAGDSEGDQNMMQDFADTQLVLIINLLRHPGSPIGALCRQAHDSYGQTEARYLLQGRDDNLGHFIPCQLRIPLGSSQGKLFP